MSSSFDAFERFQHLRSHTSSSPSRTAGEIDDMLDTLDRVFGDDADVAERHERAIREVLERLLENLEVLHEFADQAPPEPVLAGFAIAAREAVRTLLSVGWDADSPVAGTIEIEMGYDDLHRFMMAPDLNLLSPKAS